MCHAEEWVSLLSMFKSDAPTVLADGCQYIAPLLELLFLKKKAGIINAVNIDNPYKPNGIFRPLSSRLNPFRI